MSARRQLMSVLVLVCDVVLKEFRGLPLATRGYLFPGSPVTGWLAPGPSTSGAPGVSSEPGSSFSMGLKKDEFLVTAFSPFEAVTMDPLLMVISYGSGSYGVSHFRYALSRLTSTVSPTL